MLSASNVAIPATDRSWIPVYLLRQLAKAQRDLDVKDFANALPLLQKAADAGNATAIKEMGQLFEKGEGGALRRGPPPSKRCLYIVAPSSRTAKA